MDRFLRAILCLFTHKWEFHFDAKPPVVTCSRCGYTEPMPYGDKRMYYL